MKNALLIFVFTAFICGLEYASAQSPSLQIKKLLIGKWVLAGDKNFVISIKKDSIIYYYKRKVTNRKSITFSFGDSLSYYKNKEGDFNFMKDNGDVYSGIVIKEYSPTEKSTTDITIIAIDKTGMDLISGERTATFKKIK